MFWAWFGDGLDKGLVRVWECSGHGLGDGLGKGLVKVWECFEYGLGGPG